MVISFCLDIYTGVSSRVHTDQASVEKMHSVVAEVDNLKMGDDNQKFSEHENSNLSAEYEDNNLSACLANGNNGSNLSPKESLSLQNKDQLEISSISQTRQQKIQSLKEMMVKLGVLAIDPFYLDGECLNTLKSSFLSFRSLSCLYGSLRKKCSHIESYEAQLPNPAYTTAQQSTKVHRGKEKAPLSIVPCMESPVNCLGLKRQLDQSAFSEAPLKLRKTLSFSINGADAYLWRSSEGFNAAFTDTFVSGNASSVLLELFKTRHFSSIEAYAHLLRNIIGCEADLFDSFFSGTEVKLNAQNLSYIAAQSLTYMCSSSLKDLVLNLLNISHTSCNGIVEICSPLDNSGTRISYASMQQAQESEAIMKKPGTCIPYADDMTDKLLQPAAAQSVSKYAIGVPAKDDEASNIVAAGASKYQLNSHLIANELKPLPSNCDNSSSVKIREISMNVAVGCSFKEKKDLLQPVTSDLAFKSKVRQQPEVRTSFAVSRSLLMKFPKDCSLPSKEELVKKFSPFGRVDSFKTKVYFYTGSARVVFLHQLDAVAAYQYAKRKKIAFGKENVKFWLDTSGDEKRSKELASFPSQTANLPGFNLKSCLKKSKPLEKEDKRCQRKVRFQIET